MDKIKQILKSKTVLFGLLVAVLGGIQTLLPELKEIMDPMLYGLSTFIIGLTIIVLRFITTQPLDEK